MAAAEADMPHHTTDPEPTLEIFEWSPSPAGAASGMIPPSHVLDVYERWCAWLDLAEENLPLPQVVHMLAQGGEIFRSFIQFMARVSEPHRGEHQAPNDEVWKEETLRRSFMAMQITCHAFVGPTISPGLEDPRVLGIVCFELLGGLRPRREGGGGGCSLHMCTVLQHLVSSHDNVVCDFLLQYHAPFVLLRALDQPGCSELLSGLLLGCDVLLPPVVHNRGFRLLSVSLLEQVMQYLRHFSWPRMISKIVEHGARLGSGVDSLNTSCSSGGCGRGVSSPFSHLRRTPGGRSPAPTQTPPMLRTPARRSQNSWTSPGAPGWPSPEWPGLGSTPRGLSTPGFSTPGTSRKDTSHTEASPFCSMVLPPSSPSPSLPHVLLDLPVFPLELPLSPKAPPTQASESFTPTNALGTGSSAPSTPSLRRGAPASAGMSTGPSARESSTSEPLKALLSPAQIRLTPTRSSPRSPVFRGLRSPNSGTTTCEVPPRTPGSEANGGSGSSSCGTSDGAERGGGVRVLLEFLTATIEACGRAAEVMRRPKNQQRALAEGEEGVAELRAEVRLQFIQMTFVDTALISHLFNLLRCGTAQFESATLLHAVLQHALHPRRGCPSSMAEAVISLFLPHVETIGGLLLQGAPRPSRGVARRPLDRVQEQRQQTPRQNRRGGAARRELRLNAYTVHEPLGSLRVVAVQILAALCELAPERTLREIKPSVWALLAQWFLTYRCNHIFQAACGRLWVAVVQSGNVRTQHYVFVKLRLFGDLCDAVLAEGACGDRWHEVRPVNNRGAQSLFGNNSGSCLDRVEKMQVAIRKNRHPGGLGGIVPVFLALKSRSAQDEVDRQQMQRPGAKLAEALCCSVSDDDTVANRMATRQPLAPRFPPQLTQTPPNLNLADDAKLTLPAPVPTPAPVRAREPSFATKLLSESPTWPQVLSAVGQLTPSPLEGCTT